LRSLAVFAALRERCARREIHAKTPKRKDTQSKSETAQAAANNTLNSTTKSSREIAPGPLGLWLERLILGALFLFAFAAPISIAAAQFAWAMGLLFWLLRFFVGRDHDFIARRLIMRCSRSSFSRAFLHSFRTNRWFRSQAARGDALHDCVSVCREHQIGPNTTAARSRAVSGHDAERAFYFWAVRHWPGR
jgi:hypothetical protein